jgi:hypothetical protein
MHRQSPRARAQVASIFLVRLALVCYLMPVILLVFAVGGLAIGIGQISRLLHRFDGPLRPWHISSRRLMYLPVNSRKSTFSRRPEPFQKPRVLR